MRAAAFYPWAKYYHDEAAPEGGDKIVRDVVKQGFEQLAPLIEAGAKALGITVEQISPTLLPNETAPGISERAYISQVGGRRLQALNLAGYRRSGMAGLGAAAPGSSQMALKAGQQAAIETVKNTAIQSGLKAVGASAPVAGMAVAAANVLANPKAAFASKAASVNTTAAMASAGAVALGAPVVGWAVGAGMAVKGIVDLVKGTKAMKEAQAEMGRAEDLSKSIKSVADVAVGEAQLLANELVARGIPVEASGSASRLMTHYTEQLKAYKAKAELDALRYDPSVKAAIDARKAAWRAPVTAKAAAIYKDTYDKLYAKEMAIAKSASDKKLQAAQAKYSAWQASLKSPDVARKYMTYPEIKARDAAGAQNQLNKAIAEYAKPAALPETKISEIKRLAKEAEQRYEGEALRTAPATYQEKLNSATKNANDVGRQDTMRFLLQAARDMRILRKALAAGPSVVSAEQVGEVAAAVQQQAPAAYTQVVAQAAAETINSVAPEAAQYIGGGGGQSSQVQRSSAAEQPPGQSSVAGTSPAAKIAVTATTTGVVAGVVLLAWKMFAAGRAAS